MGPADEASANLGGTYGACASGKAADASVDRRRLALIWNAFGCYDYLMTRMRNTEYLASMMPDVDPNAMLAWVDGFPIYAQIRLGPRRVDGPARSVLLLMRNR